MLIKKFWLLIVFICLQTGLAFADGEVRIPLDSIRVPGNDLIYNGQVLTPEQAWHLQQDEQNPLDLSTLDPKETDFWKDTIIDGHNAKLDELPVSSGDTLNYIAPMTSPSGTLRFNILPANGETNKVFTIMLDKRLHTSLLRKNLLRKLGFIIPSMKFLKNFKLTFKDKEAKEHFIKRVIPEHTLGAPSRWIKDEKSLEDEKILTLEIHDAVIMMPSEKDHFNVAMGVPPKTLSSRILRSLAIPYALLDVAESINKVNWTEGRLDNNEIILPHFARADFNTTLDDAKWMLRRMTILDRSDIEEVVLNSHYPDSVAKVLIEKLVARRNSLYELFSIKVPVLEFETNMDIGEEVKNGRILKEEWEGYASRFAHGLPDSPFADFGYFIWSKLQTSLIDNLMSTANSFLEGFDVGEARGEFAVERFQEGLEHFVETGEFSDLGVGTWTSPIANGSLIMSRDIVIGNHLGTDNLVQLADTFGYSVRLGGHLGIEAPLGENWSGFVRGDVSYVKTYSHLKPVNSLKATFKEPYANIIVPFVKKKLGDGLSDLGDLAEDDSLEGEARDEKIAEILEHINKNLGVGESLLITDRLAPSIAGGVSMLFPQSGTSISISTGANALIVKRTHIYRKSSGEVQVYVDKGKLGSVFISFALRDYIPILELRSKVTKGKYKVKVYNININEDLEENPDFFRSAKALEQLVKDGSTELMDSIQKPYKIENEFLDKSSRMSFLMWRSKHINGTGSFTVTTPKDHKTHYLQIRDESQAGINYQAFVTDIVNYYIGQFIADLDADYLAGAQLPNNRWRNPGQSFHGMSQSRFSRFESRLVGEGKDLDKLLIARPFISITHQKEGWSISRKKLKKEAATINRKFGKVLFSSAQLNDVNKLKLYDISVHTNLYEDAIDSIKNLNSSVIEKIQRRYKAERRNTRACRRDPRLRINRQSTIKCGNLKSLIALNKRCKELAKENESSKKQGRCLLVFASKLEASLEFKDFLKIVGGERNIYVHGQINGFRDDSEILNDPIIANTLGEIASRQWNGPLDAVKSQLGVQSGEFDGRWIRESVR